jgi:hypothetical protein
LPLGPDQQSDVGNIENAAQEAQGQDEGRVLVDAEDDRWRKRSNEGQLPNVLVDSTSEKMVEAWESLLSLVDYIWYHAGKQGIGGVGHVPHPPTLLCTQPTIW